MDKSTAELQTIVGYPEYRLLENGTRLSPLEVWNPPPVTKKKFTAHELYELFRNECVAFIGDSLQRRAADALHILIENRANEYADDGSHYVYPWPEKNAAYTRIIGRDPSKSSNSTVDEKAPCQPGTIDNLWFPTHASFKHFEFKKKYTIVIANFGAWDAERGSYSPREWKVVMNKTLHHLYTSVPKSVPIYWKTSPWGWRFEWNFLQPNAKPNTRRRSNYAIYFTNRLARDWIENSSNAINNMHLIDWSKEMLPYSFSERKHVHMEAEDHETNAWHVGPKGRGLLIQMLADEIHKQRRNSIYNQSLENMNTIELQDGFQELLFGFVMGVICTSIVFRRQIVGRFQKKRSRNSPVLKDVKRKQSKTPRIPKVV
eukprot:scaffold1170_cov122-Cylindrotheca_fusiformis.AAC.17